MANRPNYLDLRSQSHGPIGTGLPSPRSLPSPRLHIAGDVPPELSPLDAFAAQSRRLAKELERGMNGEKRMSRLPPLTIASSLGQSRPTYFRSASAEAASGTPTSPTNSPGIGVKTEVEAPANRPVSVYPVVSEAQPSLPQEPSPRFNLHDEEQFRGRSPASQPGGPGYFGVRREQSPPTLEREQKPIRTEYSPSANIHPRPSAESMRQRLQQPRRLNDVFLGMGSYDSRALAPPRSPFAQRAPSPRSMSMDSSDEDCNNSNPPYTLSPHRKLSSSSGLSTSPISPTMQPIPRSPSISSEISVGGTRLPRPAFNFSRPLSRASVNGIPAEVPSRQASSDSQPSFVLADDTAHTPVSMYSEGFPDNNSESGAAPSYVYSRFSLPRGKMLQRNSLIFQESLPQAQFSWEQPVPFSNVQAFHGGAPPSPPSRPSTSSLRPDPTRPSLDPGRPSIDPARPSLDAVRSSTERGRATERSLASNNRAHSQSISSSGTIKAKSQHSLAPSAEASAARQNHPTGMLLYALACRHGWGMRPNQREGVIWLRKAADSASLEIADDEDLLKGGKTVDILERKTRKAQFALSIYELGVSHMNGWGIEQDKALALRCFEIAGSWGDADALAEAGFCYAQAIGCKKDLKKSARFYRQAESKGISMVGNSWIYKAKYNDGDDPKISSESHSRPSLEKDKDKKPRNKSRSRNMFGRMKPAS
ncbi:Mitosis inhibitor [Lachnellula subtilissima]|uniref:Mitosis inhibitor n=1 Tax=Lachnellula subtilissima TaxID=602034 RepID=A0A8H8RZG9_9HELO|nr:Mitosis inhibitor [Lachnellula subtilissima]